MAILKILEKMVKFKDRGDKIIKEQNQQESQVHKHFNPDFLFIKTPKQCYSADLYLV